MLLFGEIKKKKKKKKDHHNMGHASLFGFISTGGSQLLVSSWPIELDRYVTIMYKEE